MSKRALKMAETKRSIIAAARKSFAEYGYSDTSMDKLTADVNLTRGALYHNFGDKKGLFAAVVEEIDLEMVEKAKTKTEGCDNLWQGLMIEGQTYIESALDPEIQRIILLDGPAVLGDPSLWPSQNRCLLSTKQIVTQLIAEGTMKEVDPEAASMLINGAAMNASLWIASNPNPQKALPNALAAFNVILSGLKS
ncbi:TetR/AcrR family transcriptional regulator [Psychrobacter aquaticus]|uniref:Transcriptional regulator, TetR family n=1 Tax=Psychrobacter aquaticus CMS 56 TaxID=1354303 RepID=U4T2H7_9GAMM|nr:TetR/AcrR family transcriptional regulator [Psychrobacter aquaticus]ERL54750.1 Transcriptional regulator, TetR family [Psychrobacter aquaticus CMS 56]